MDANLSKNVSTKKGALMQLRRFQCSVPSLVTAIPHAELHLHGREN